MKNTELIRKLEAAQMANAGAQKVINDLRNDNSELRSIVARLTAENEKLTDKLNREIIKNRDIKSDYKRMGDLCTQRENSHINEVLKLGRELDRVQLEYETQEDNATHYRDELEKAKAIAEKYRKIAVENYEKILKLKGENLTDAEHWRAAWDGERKSDKYSEEGFTVKAEKLDPYIANELITEWNKYNLMIRAERKNPETENESIRVILGFNP